MYVVLRMVVDTVWLAIMTLVTVLGPVIVATVLALLLPRRHGIVKSSFRLMAIRAGAVIAAARVVVFVAAAYVLTNYGDIRQVAAYVVVMLDALPEMALASALNGRRPGSVPAVAVLIVLTSFAAGWCWALARIQTPIAHEKGMK